MFLANAKMHTRVISLISFAASHTLSGSTLAPRSRSGSFNFLRLSLTLILMVMGVSCDIALELFCVGAAMVDGVCAVVSRWCRFVSQAAA